MSSTKEQSNVQGNKRFRYKERHGQNAQMIDLYKGSNEIFFLCGSIVWAFYISENASHFQMEAHIVPRSIPLDETILVTSFTTLLNEMGVQVFPITVTQSSLVTLQNKYGKMCDET